MKNKRFTALLLIIAFSIFFALNSNAAELSAGISGPSVVRAGDTVTVTFSLNGENGLFGMQGYIFYDADSLTLSDTKTLLSSLWTVELTKNTGDIQLIAYDNEQNNPINGNKAVFSMTFKVKSNVEEGNKITIYTRNIETSDRNRDITAVDGSLTMTVGAPLSGNNYLSALTIDNGTLTPSFSKSDTSYSVTVPFEVSTLNVTATPEDSKAKVTVSGGNLTAGETSSIKITVTAENNSKKVYTINAKRESDPNAVTNTSSSETSKAEESNITISDDTETALAFGISEPPIDKGGYWGIPLWGQIAVGIILLVLGFASGFFAKDIVGNLKLNLFNRAE